MTITYQDAIKIASTAVPLAPAAGIPVLYASGNSLWQTDTISNRPLIQSLGISTNGNTLGTTGFINGQMAFIGGNNITLSQSVNGLSASLTIVGAAGSTESNTFGISNLGNTSGTSGVVSGNQIQVVLAGGNNVTLSQSINGSSATITVSAGGAPNLVQFIPLNNSNIADAFLTGIFYSSAIIWPLIIPGNLNISSIKLIWQGRFSGTGTGNVTGSISLSNSFGIYSLNGNTLSLASGSNTTFEMTQTANGAGGLTGTLVSSYGIPATWNITPGNWWMIAVGSSSSTHSNITLGQSAFFVYPAGVALNSLPTPNTLAGFNSAYTTNSIPSSLALSDVATNFSVGKTQWIILGTF